MKIRELPVPELDANEILVRVEAAGFGYWRKGDARIIVATARK